MSDLPEKPANDALDLSGAAAPQDRRIDELLLDAKTRRQLRIWASGIAAGVVAWLLVLVSIAVLAAVQDLAKVSAPVVSFVSVLIVALGALGIVAIKSIFADTGHTNDKKPESVSFPAGALEMAKAIIDAAKTIVGAGK